MQTPDYSKYSYQELIEAKKAINKQEHPENYKRLIDALEKQTQLEEAIQHAVKEEDASKRFSDYLLILKLILPFYLLSLVITQTLPLGARWILEKNLALDIVKLEWWELWIPFSFSFLVIHLTMSSKLSLLLFKNDKGRFLLQIVAWLTFSIPSIIAQTTFTDVAYDLVKLPSLQEYPNHKTTKFYEVENFSIQGKALGTHIDVRHVGRDRKTLKFQMFAVVPFISPSDSEQYWLGIHQSESIKSNLSQNTKERYYNDFINDSWQELQRYDFTEIKYFEKIGKSEKRDFYQKAIEDSLGGKVDKPFVLLQPSLKTFTQDEDYYLIPIIALLLIGSILFTLLLLIPRLCHESYRKYKAGTFKKESSLSFFKDMLIPNREHLVTPILINANLIVFAVLWFSGVDAITPSSQELLDWGANRREDTLNGEWWRLVTSMFLHAGIGHLMLNMYGLIIASLFIEPILGRLNMLFLYFASGVCGSMASVFWYDNTVSVGASGAIFGLLGAVLALLPTRTFPKEMRPPLFTMFGSYVLISLLMGLAGGIDNAAHIGGLVSGATLSFLIYLIYLRKNLD